MKPHDITVTDTFKIKVDNYGNHQPMYFVEGGQVIEKGAYKGQLTKDSWKAADKYFRSPAEAIWWGVQEGHVGEDLTISGEVTVKEYLTTLEKQIKLLENIVGGMIK